MPVSYRHWQQIVKQELNQVKGLVQGKIGIDGHLPVVLTWTRSILVLAESTEAGWAAFAGGW